MTPYYKDKLVTIWHGRWQNVLPTPEGRYGLLLTDPPYGIERFRKGFGTTRFAGHGCEKDGIGWDVAPDRGELDALVAFASKSVIWGMNFLPLPRSEHFLVWDKQQTVDNFADAELAWTDLPITKVFRYAIHRHNREKCGGHPTEKPVPLMAWCLRLAKNPASVLDPYGGTGATARACKDAGIPCVMVEAEERFCERAAYRMQGQALPI